MTTTTPPEPVSAVSHVALITSPGVVCSCPSGDGSLRWPCPTHPPRIRVERCVDDRSTLSAPVYAPGWVVLDPMAPDYLRPECSHSEWFEAMACAVWRAGQR